MDIQRLHRAMIDNVNRYEHDRLHLMLRAKEGDAEAAAILWARWKYRVTPG